MAFKLTMPFEYISKSQFSCSIKFHFDFHIQNRNYLSIQSAHDSDELIIEILFSLIHEWNLSDFKC